MIKVLVVDDHQMIRQALRAVLAPEEDIEVVGEASNGAEAVREVCRLYPDVVLLDLRMPEMDGLETLEKIKREASKTRVIILSILDERECVREAFNLGASGYALKDVREKDLVEIIRGITSGQSYVHPLVRRFVLEQLKQQAGDKKLTKSERAILQLVAEGLSDEEISEELEIELAEAGKQISTIFDKLELAERVQEIAVELRKSLSA